jgi:hypothetical protein
LVELEPRAGARHEIVPEATIGRAGCDIVVSDDLVSRRHAAFRATEHGIAIEDLGSRNGTYVNDRRVEGLQAVGAGDTLRIGRVQWRFEGELAGETVLDRPAPAPPAAAPPPPAPAPAPAAAPPPPAPPAAAPPPPAPAPAAAPPPAGAERRGDVPAPAAAPSAPPPVPASAMLAPPAFTQTPARRIGGSAARSETAVLASYAVVLLTAVALIVYFAAR